MVEGILKLSRLPCTIRTRKRRIYIVLLTVENRQPHVYKLLLKSLVLKGSVFKEVDNQGNSALHLAAKLGDHEPWLIPGAALQMQWEFKWYEFVKESMPRHIFSRYNIVGQISRPWSSPGILSQTLEDLFTDTHKELVKNGGKWLSKTSESCYVVAALIATVAFATSATVLRGVKQDVGALILEKHLAFDVFSISSLIALYCSVTAVVMFLAI
ncbi:hypothetical protein CJ030_MR4G020435 [Morella rubra]|uniref:PGG domain-containing protein n=1 Tax=Morella rubra TaxID=262757 RepID=A0A6A1VST0_9ROSI|nr:hypothetical protein CJ030_MR4G020435 [Morella rubra]